MLLLWLYLAVPEISAAPSSPLGLYLVTVSALTLPHVALVAFITGREVDPEGYIHLSPIAQPLYECGSYGPLAG